MKTKRRKNKVKEERVKIKKEKIIRAEANKKRFANVRKIAIC